MDESRHPVRDIGERSEPQEPAGLRRWQALAVVCMAQFMLILDLTVVNVALPDLGTDLDLSRTAFTWAVSVYVLFFGGLLLLGGRLADILGARPMMLTGLVIFTLASLACGLAQNEALLICGRIGQGVGAALLSPAALTAITSIFHGEERNKALSVWASLGGIGFAAGVVIGGTLTAGPGWRWVFFINVPVGIVLLAAVRAVVQPRRRPDRDGGHVDVLGAVIVTAATGSLIYGMINAGDARWADLGTLLPIAAAVVLYGIFVVVERAVRTPLMHLSLLTRRPVSAGAFLMFVASGVLIADLFLGSQYLQHLRGLSALETGLFFLPAALALMIGAIVTGRTVGTGTRRVAAVGLALVAIGNGLLIGVSTDGNIYVEALPGIVVFALGGGALFVAATTSALAHAGQHESGLVSGIVYTFNQLGAATFVAVASTVAAAGLARTPSVDGFTDAFTVFTVATAVATVVALGLVPAGKRDNRAAPAPSTGPDHS
jgi:EmrB/QacA subfamily drug resistance transporter